MIWHVLKTHHLFVLAAFLLSPSLQAQPPLPSTITIEVENYVEYLGDIADPYKLGTDQNVTTPKTPLPNTFLHSDHLGDIVSVNGQLAKGFAVSSARVLGSMTVLTPGRPIADVTTTTYRSYYFQILNAEGISIGTIYTSGPLSSPPPPGSPSGVTTGDFVVLGGTGAFVGIRGQGGLTPVAAGRLASASEDPSRRRILGGGKRRFIFTIYPLAYPVVLSSNGSPAVTHSSDFSLVSTARPAAAGEILSAFVSGLGPTRPGVEPGSAFPQSPLAQVSSPVQVTVGGKQAEVLSAVGYPGAVDGYQVNFRVPEGLAAGSVAVRISSGWIAGNPVTISVK